MNAEIVPFGKYKGQPVEVMVADRSYVEWLSGQPWFRERYAPTYQMIINYGQAPTETPEHNEMQIAFLDEAWSMNVARAAYQGALDFDKPTKAAEEWAAWLRSLPPTWGASIDFSPAGTDHPGFECKGWDVVYNMFAASYEASVSMPDCTCAGRHVYYAPEYKTCPRTWPDGMPSSGEGMYRRELEEDGSTYLPTLNRTICVECKPDLGDDFPAVLRQIKAREAPGRQVLLVRRSQFERVTLGDVRKVFSSAGIKLLLEDEVR